MERKPWNVKHSKKPTHAIDREYTVALYLLRCTQLGLHYEDLEHLTVGMVTDLLVEQANDNYDYPLKATQKDFDRF